jgi:hypothetical protein
MKSMLSHNDLRTIAIVVTIASVSSGSAVAASGRVDVQVVDIVPTEFRNGRATACNLMADLANHTGRNLNDLTIRVGDLQLHVGKMLSDKDGNNRGFRSNIGSVNPSATSTCADVASDILENIAGAKVSACAMDGIAESECRSLVRIFDGPEFLCDREQEA